MNKYTVIFKGLLLAEFSYKPTFKELKALVGYKTRNLDFIIKAINQE